MSNTPTAEVRPVEAGELEALKPLWEDLYAHQVAHGMHVRVPVDGYAQWSKGLRPLLGRYARVWAARLDGQPEGFLCARLRNQPPHFGSEPTGFISDVYVSPALRRQGVGRRLLQAALDWFDAQDLRRVELQVIAGNPEARALYLELGWQDELVQMVRLKRPPSA